MAIGQTSGRTAEGVAVIDGTAIVMGAGCCADWVPPIGVIKYI